MKDNPQLECSTLNIEGFQRVANEMAPKWKIFSPEKQTKKKKNTSVF